MTTNPTTEAGDERARVGRAMLRAYARRPDSLAQQTGGPLPSLLTPKGRLLAAEQLLHDMLTALADDGVDVPEFLADALAEAWGEDEAETTPFIRYRSPSWVYALGRAAIELYGTYGGPSKVLTDYQAHVVNDAAQLLANLDGHSEPCPAKPEPDSDVLGSAAAILWELHGDDNGVLTPEQTAALDHAMSVYITR
ncbi:hypothetical protein ACWDRB_47145 [Nonomuraea sp. NPDC003707]